MKIFFFTTFVLLALVFAFNFWMDPGGLGLMYEPQTTRTLETENPEKCALDSTVVRAAQNFPFKRWLLKHRKPETIAVGTSRVLPIHQRHFSGPFVNLGFVDTRADDYPNLVKILREHPEIHFVLLSVDIWDFVKHGIYIIWDSLIDFSSPSMRPFVSHLLLKLLSPFETVYSGAADKYWETFKEYLSYDSTKRSLEAFKTYGLSHKRFFKISLPEKNFADSKCVLFTTPDLGRSGATSVIDGSQYSPEDLVGKQMKTDFSEFTLPPSGELKSHWRPYIPLEYTKKYSTYRLGSLEYLLEEADKLNVHIVGFQPPLPKQILEGFKKLGIEQQWLDFTDIITKIFQRHGREYVSFIPETPGCPDPESYMDGWHPWTKCYENILKELKRRDPVLPIKESLR